MHSPWEVGSLLIKGTHSVPSLGGGVAEGSKDGGDIVQGRVIMNQFAYFEFKPIL